MKFESKLEEFLYNSGFNRTMSILIGFRGPVVHRFRDRWYYYPYWVYSIITDISMVLNMLSFSGLFFIAGVHIGIRARAGFPFMTCVYVLFRMVYDWYYRPSFQNFIEKLDSIFIDDYDYYQELENYSKRNRFISWLLLFLNFFMFPFGIFPLVREYRGLPRELAVPVWFPIDIKDSSVVFWAFVFLQAMGSSLSPSKLIVSDNICICYVTRQIMFARYLGKKLRDNLRTVEVDKRGNIKYRTTKGVYVSKEEVTEYLYAELKKWILLHQIYDKLTKELQSLMSPLLGVQFLVMGAIVCICAFVAVAADLDKVIIFFCVLFVLGNALDLLVICWMGDLLIYETSVLSHNTLGSHLYTLPKEVTQMFRIVLTRLQKPTKLSALGVFLLNTDTYRSMMLTTYSFFTMLREMKARFG